MITVKFEMEKIKLTLNLETPEFESESDQAEADKHATVIYKYLLTKFGYLILASNTMGYLTPMTIQIISDNLVSTNDTLLKLTQDIISGEVDPKKLYDFFDSRWLSIIHGQC